MAYINRRHFLTGTATSFLGAGGALGTLTARNAWAANTTGYKAMVCVFLKGGMDHADTVLPYDQTSYDQIATVRAGLFNTYNSNDGASSRNRANLLALNPDNAADFGGRQFALPPELSGLHSMFESGDLAIAGNVGPLIEPTTQDDMNARRVQLPPRLYSHNDQQSTWMSLKTEGARYGWGGRFADAALASDSTINPLYVAVATSGNDVFLSGDQARQFSLPTSGVIGGINVVDQRYLLGGNSRFDAARAAMRDYYERKDFAAQNLYRRDVDTASGEGVENARKFSDALDMGLPFTTEFPNTNLGRQLRRVAETIGVQSDLDVSRQIFYTTNGGFDTHNNQANSLPNLHQQMNDAFVAFRSALQERGLWNQVTLFTASDFGRTLNDNGDGTDHGWGAHHFVMGGSVQGKRIYGDMPSPEPTSQSYTRSRGRLIPSLSVEQYAAGLGNWFGLDNGEIASVLPNLTNFPTGAADLFGAGGA